MSLFELYLIELLAEDGWEEDSGDEFLYVVEQEWGAEFVEAAAQAWDVCAEELWG